MLTARTVFRKAVPSIHCLPEMMTAYVSEACWSHPAFLYSPALPEVPVPW